MARYPMIQANDAAQQMTETFGGLNRALKIREGEWHDCMNLTSDRYPMLASRRKRTRLQTSERSIYDLHLRDGNRYTIEKDGDSFWLCEGGRDLVELDAQPKQMVSFGAYIIMTGVDKWYNTADGTHGDIGASFAMSETELTDFTSYRAHVVSMFPCDADGNELRILAAGDAKQAAEIEADPTSAHGKWELPRDGDCLLNGTARTIRKYHAASSLENPSMWETMPVLLRISAVGIGTTGLEAGDTVNIHGLPTALDEGVYAEDWDIHGEDPAASQTVYNSRIGQYDESPNGLHTVHSVGEDYIVLQDVLLGRRITASYEAVSSAGYDRGMPDMDYVVEAQNRLWGCKYGEVDGEKINEIYASALGDFKNWRQYDGTSMASWTASVGTDGAWTGAITYNGQPLFFKNNRMHKVYPSAYGAHQIKDYAVDGIRDNESGSLCMVNSRIFWRGTYGIYAYDGGTPSRISDALGHEYLRNLFVTSAGGANGKVYFSVYGAEPDEPEQAAVFVLVYDIRHQIWHKEGHAGVIKSEPHGPVAGLVADNKQIVDLIGTPTSTAEKAVEWSCTSGLIGYGDPEQKYVSRFDLRLYLAQDAAMQVWIEYDSSGNWDKQAELQGTGTGSVMIPVRPRRCDHFRIRMTGSGEMALWSFAKKYSKGSDVV